MDLQNGKISKLYFKFLVPCLMSTAITSIYTLVDTIVVGQYEGANGAAALACVAPVWTLFCCIPMLFGFGGAVLFSNWRGKGDERESQSFFTVSFILMMAVTVVVWLSIMLFDREMLILFGAADEEILALALRYTRWLGLGVPLYTVSIFLCAFIRNDGSPKRAGLANLIGGVYNIFADVFLTFTLDLGIEGAAIATVTAQALNLSILLTHFLSKKNGIRFARPRHFLKKSAQIVSIGLPSFVQDICLAVIIVLFNNQVMRYYSAVELAIFGVASNLYSNVQTLTYGIGTATQPIIAENLGACKVERVRRTMRYGVLTAFILGGAITAVTELIPLQLVRLYMTPTPEVLAAAAPLLRMFFVCFVFTSVNVYAAFYLQAVMRVRSSVTLSLLRSVFLSAAFIIIMPLVFGKESLWLSMTATEAVVTALSLLTIASANKNLKTE